MKDHFTNEILMTPVMFQTLLMSLRKSHEESIKNGSRSNNNYIYYARSLVDWYINKYDQNKTSKRIDSFEELKKSHRYAYSWLERNGRLITDSEIRQIGRSCS